MPDLRSSPLLKTLAVILFTCLAVFSAYCMIGTTYMESVGVYDTGVSSYEETYHAQLYRDGMRDISYYRFYGQLFTLCYPYHTELPIWAAFSFLLALGLLVYLFFAAGHRRNMPGVNATSFERIPLDILFVVVAALCSGAVVLLTNVFSLGWELGSMFALPLSFLLVLLVLLFLLSFVTRFKLGGWWRNTLCYLLLRLLQRVWLFFWRPLRQVCSNLPLLWKFLLLFGGFALVSVMLLSVGHGSSSAFFVWLVMVMLITLFVGNLITQLAKLQRTAQDLADGKEGVQLDTRQMYRITARHGNNLNSIGEGITRAVESRMKSEHMRTELIANVSHDIKTPLTSIINYVDLLKKEDIDNEAVRNYLDVIDRQSIRLKKLTEDVIEVSKVSTGNIAVNAAPTHVAELLDQCIAEYADRFARAQLTPMLSKPEEDALIMADGRLMWRVFDNLLNNICKYSLAHTRIYITVRIAEGNVCVELKNISRDVLRISEEELMGRFVRGDASRNSEGSGLGLSIAHSLVQLQKGSFDIHVDGDLFKATLCFPHLQEDAVETEVEEGTYLPE